MLRKAGFSHSNGCHGWACPDTKKRWTPPWKRKLSSGQSVIIMFALVSTVGLVWVARGGERKHQQIQLPHQTFHASSKELLTASSLEFPIWWHAPFVSPSGLGSEAIMIVQALVSTGQLRTEDIYITHSGDAFDQSVLKSFSRDTRNILSLRQHPQQVADEFINTLLPMQRETQLQRLRDMSDHRRAIAVCHNWFDCWRQPGKEFDSAGWPGCPCPLSKNRTAYTIARTMFETAGLPAHLAEHVNAMDEVWVPTQFNKETFTNAGVDPTKIRVVPQGVDTEFWDPANYAPIKLDTLKLVQATGPDAAPNSTLKGSRTVTASRGINKPYIFLSVFKWEARKGWKDLVQGFCNAFNSTDPVELWILSKPFQDSGTDFDKKVLSYAAQYYKMSVNDAKLKLPRIYTSSQHLSEVDFVRVYKAVDALVIPTHGEGWGRPQSEAMAMGLPVITTNWSGPTAYMNDDIAYPLAIDGLSVVESEGDPNFFEPFIGQKWAQPSVKHLTQLMQHVYKNPEEAAAKGAAARKHIQEHFSPKQIAAVVAREVRRLQKIVRQRQPQGKKSGRGFFSDVQSSISRKGIFTNLGTHGNPKQIRGVQTKQ